MEIPRIKDRKRDAHKGDFGRVLIIGGSRGMAGAAALAGMAATRSGAGLVTVAVPSSCLDTVASFSPNYMTLPLPEQKNGQIAAEAATELLRFAETCTSLAIGPGLGRSEPITDLVTSMYEHYEGPIVIDADGLNALAQSPEILDCPHVRVLTPHIGEFRRLTGKSDATVEACRQDVEDFAEQHGVIIVLKGRRSLVVDGESKFENATGNPGMATGGSGDVLTGVIAALLSQKDYSALEAVVLGVHIHGLAGDLAADAFGEISMTASDIKSMLGGAFQAHRKSAGMGFHT